MPTGNDSYVENTLEVLRAFLVSSYPIYKRKNIQSGLGLKKEDFNKKPYEGFNQTGTKRHDASSKMFWKRKYNLLYDYHIVELQSNERGKFYGITPIGIAYFCEYVEDIDSEIFESIFSHLKFWYEKGKPKEEKSYLDNLQNIIRAKSITNIPESEKEIKIEFKDTFSYFKVEHKVEDYIYLKLTYLPTFGMEIILSEFIYSKGSDGLDNDGTYTVISDSSKGTLNWTDKDIDGYTFNYLLSKFLIKAFLHTLYVHMQNITLPFQQNQKEFQELLKEIHPKNRKHVKKELNKYRSILKAFDQDHIGVVKEFQKEINKAVKLYTSAFESESKLLMLS